MGRRFGETILNTGFDEDTIDLMKNQVFITNGLINGEIKLTPNRR